MVRAAGEGLPPLWLAIESADEAEALIRLAGRARIGIHAKPPLWLAIESADEAEAVLARAARRSSG